MQNSATSIAHFQVVPEVDPAVLHDQPADQPTHLLQRVGLGAFQVGELLSFIILNSQFVVEVEEVARHVPLQCCQPETVADTDLCSEPRPSAEAELSPFPAAQARFALLPA